MKKKPIIQSLFSLLIWIPVLIIPILHTNSTIDANIHIRFIALSFYLLTLCCFAFFLFKQNGFLFIPNDRLFILFALYAALSLPGCIISPFASGDSLFEWMKILLLPSIAFLTTAIFRDQINFISNLSKSITLLALILLLYAVYQLASVVSTTSIGHQAMYNIKTTFAHKNIFSEILLMMLPFTIYCLVSLNNLWRWIGLGCTFLILTFIVILMTRAVWVAFSCSSAALFFLYICSSVYKKTIKVSKRAIYTITVFGAVILASIVTYTHYDKENVFVKQVSNIFNFNYGSTKERIVLWKNSRDIFMEHPFWGAGMGNWQIEILKYGSNDLVSENTVTFYQRPHNDFIWILTEQGIFSFLIYLSILVAVCYNIIKIIMRTQNSEECIFFYLLFFGFIGYCTFSFFSFPKERAEHLLFLSFYISSILISKQRLFPMPKNSIRNTFSVPTLILILLVGVFSLSVSATRLKSEQHLANAFNARQANDWKTMIFELDQTESLFYHIDQVSTPLRWYRGLANFNLNNLQDALYDFKQAYFYNPYHIHVLNNLGTCYEMTGKHSEAIEYFEKAITLSPAFDEARFNLCASLFNSGHGVNAYLQLREIKHETMTEKYNHFLEFLLPSGIKTIRDTADKKTRERIETVQNSNEWMREIHLKSIRNNNSLEKQLILDLIYTSEIILKDTAEANRLKDKYSLMLK